MSDDHNLQKNSRKQDNKINEVDHHSKTNEDHGAQSPNTELKLDDILVQEGHESCKNVQECRTPTSKESKIPRASSCPPAPRRKRREEVVISNKRKLIFFEDTVGGSEEIESLFETSSSVDDHVSRNPTTVKRRRRSR
ncbi:hypothetical protein POM88_029738 [Heracleum sosnowskyi]|uniref:Uncharacterized protein n=1 Tax=Heracleum sosnowskyi TaxID=360622 RepID=A0AAD8MF44_9APIA|nr:hypothetical protein POM88_029738 [Heracleum sosnowskyi]